MFFAELLFPPFDQEFRGRQSNFELLRICIISQLLPPPNRRTQKCVCGWTLRFGREPNWFVNGGMFGSRREEELIKTESQKIAKIDIYQRRSKLADPGVEQGEIS